MLTLKQARKLMEQLILALPWQKSTLTEMRMDGVVYNLTEIHLYIHNSA